MEKQSQMKNKYSVDPEYQFKQDEQNKARHAERPDNEGRINVKCDMKSKKTANPVNQKYGGSPEQCVDDQLQHHLEWRQKQSSDYKQQYNTYRIGYDHTKIYRHTLTP